MNHIGTAYYIHGSYWDSLLISDDPENRSGAGIISKPMPSTFLSLTMDKPLTVFLKQIYPLLVTCLAFRTFVQGLLVRC